MGDRLNTTLARHSARLLWHSRRCRGFSVRTLSWDGGCSHRITVLPNDRHRGGSRLFSHARLPVMVLVIRFGISGLSGLSLWLTHVSLGSRGGLTGFLCGDRQRQSKHDGRSEGYSIKLPEFHSILLSLPGKGGKVRTEPGGTNRFLGGIPRVAHPRAECCALRLGA